jgi:hypothetical protein
MHKAAPAPIAHLDRAMVGIGPLQDIIETAFYTACLKNSVPLSLILVGPPGSGKSKLILQFQADSILVTNDITSQGLSDIVTGDPIGNVRHIIIPDFNIVVSHKPTTSNLTIASLLTLMSEGVLRLDDGRRKKEMEHPPIGIVTAMTREIYEEHAGRFRKLGIGRRFIPVFFNYGIKTKEEVQDAIRDGLTTLCQLEPHDISLPPREMWPFDITTENGQAERLRNLSRDMAEQLSFYPQWEKVLDAKSRSLSWQIVPFRGAQPIEFTPHMILRAMAQAHALRADRRQITSADVDFCINFVTFMNYSQPVNL